MRIRAVRSIIRAARRANYTLLRLEMYATGMTEPSDSDASSSENEDGARGSMASWKESENELKHILTRNATLKHQVEKEALALLRYSRALLLRPKGRAPHGTLPATVPCSDSCSCVQASADTLFSVIGQPLSFPPPVATGPAARGYSVLRRGERRWLKGTVKYLHLRTMRVDLGELLERLQMILLVWFNRNRLQNEHPCLVLCVRTRGPWINLDVERGPSRVR